MRIEDDLNILDKSNKEPQNPPNDTKIDEKPEKTDIAIEKTGKFEIQNEISRNSPKNDISHTNINKAPNLQNEQSESEPHPPNNDAEKQVEVITDKMAAYDNEPRSNEMSECGILDLNSILYQDIKDN